MNANSKLLHYLKLGLGGLVTLCQYVAQSDPHAAAYSHLIAGVAGAVLVGLGGFGLLSAPSDQASK